MLVRIFTVAALALHLSPSSAAEYGAGCKAKEAEIEANIAAATTRGNQHELAGLNKALRATKANCTEESLQKDREDRIEKARQEVAERERDLAEAEKNGDAKKIEKRREKLAEAQQELASAEQP